MSVACCQYNSGGAAKKNYTGGAKKEYYFIHNQRLININRIAISGVSLRISDTRALPSK